MLKRSHQTGFTLIELLISVAVIGMLVLGVYRIVDSTISAYQETGGRQDLLAQARYAMDRMALFVQETDQIAEPSSAEGGPVLKVSDRVMNLYDNATRAYVAAGDNYLDCDADRNGVIDREGSDPYTYITYDLDGTDPANIKLRETLPDYASGETGACLAPRVICEHITSFQCVRKSGNLVEISLSLKQGASEASLRTRIKSRLLN